MSQIKQFWFQGSDLSLGEWTSLPWAAARGLWFHSPTTQSLAYLPHEVLDDAVLRHLRADGEAALELLLNAGQHLLVLLCREAFCPWRERQYELSVAPRCHSQSQGAHLLCLPPHLHVSKTSENPGANPQSKVVKLQRHR